MSPKCAAHGYLLILLIYVFSSSVCAGLTLDKYESDIFYWRMSMIIRMKKSDYDAVVQYCLSGLPNESLGLLRDLLMGMLSLLRRCIFLLILTATNCSLGLIVKCTLLLSRLVRKYHPWTGAERGCVTVGYNLIIYAVHLGKRNCLLRLQMVGWGIAAGSQPRGISHPAQTE